MSGRRANGEGTITKRKDGRYQGAAYVLASDGTRRRRYIYGKTREEVHDRLIALVHRSQRGLPVSVERWTVECWLLHWHAEVVGSRLRATTLSGYGIVIRIHLVPALGSKLLDRLTPQDVRRLLARAREQGLSVRMVQYIHAVLRNALQHAVREEMLARNVAKLVQVETPDYEVGRGLPSRRPGLC